MERISTRSNVERLVSEGRMTEHGLSHVLSAKEDGRWEQAYTASEMEVPADFIAALEHEPIAKQFFHTLTKSSRYVIARDLSSAKRATTRQRRFNKFMDMLAREEKPL
ncbi:MAG: YdeI/OmpD-associated family protein [Pseudohongiellaceae bacterium]|nr:YdeI/OmpD-associated family protein [Pseudohongiellaceae bacterium]